MDLIDIGANLTHDSFDHDRDAVLQRAREAGVAQMVVTGASRAHSPQALALAQAHPGFLFATAGVHPHHAVEYTEECDAEMRALLAHPEVVAVGECGLDYFRDFSPRPAQRRADLGEAGCELCLGLDARLERVLAAVPEQVLRAAGGAGRALGAVANSRQGTQPSLDVG